MAEAAIRQPRTVALAFGVLVLATATVGTGVALMERANVYDVASWCTVPSEQIVVDGEVVVTTPQIGPIWCGP